MRVSLWGMLGCFSACYAIANGQPRLEAFEKAQQARERLRTGVVEFKYQRAGDRFGSTLYTAQIAENGDTLANLGRGEIGRFYDSDGNIVPRGPHLILHTSGVMWASNSDGLFADEVHDDKRTEHTWNMRSLGLNIINSTVDPHETLWRGQASARNYTESVENGLAVVRAQTDYGTITWYFDPQRDWNPVHVTKELDGKIVQETRITLDDYDGVWYPATVEFFGADYFRMEKPYEVMSVTAASFNRPDQPRTLTPADIGIEAGTHIDVWKEDGKHEPMMFDGQKSVPAGEFLQRIAKGEVKRGPNNVRALAEAEAAAAERMDVPADARTRDPTAARNDRESAWEKYTREFIAKYHLDDGQSQKAFGILRECQEEANQYLLRHRTEFDKLREETRKIAQADSPDADRLTAITQQRAKLRRPIHEIFDRQLKPHLEKLPTRAQRAAAEREQPPATQP